MRFGVIIAVFGENKKALRARKKSATLTAYNKKVRVLISKLEVFVNI